MDDSSSSPRGRGFKSHCRQVFAVNCMQTPKRRASFWVDPYKRDESWKELNNQTAVNETWTQKTRAVLARTMFYLWNVLEMENHMTVVGRGIRIFTNVLIVYTSLQIILFSEQSFLISQSPIIWIFFAVEYFAILFFVAEVGVRFVTCTSSAKYIRHGPILGRLLFLVSPKTLVDIVAIGPSIGAAIYDANVYFHNDDITTLVNPVTSRGVDVLRLIRLVKLTRNARFFRVLGKIIIRKRSEIANILVCMIIIVVLFSSMMCWLEGGIQPNYFGSIPRSFYFCLVTLMTIGFGDVSAETSKQLAIIIINSSMGKDDNSVIFTEWDSCIFCNDWCI